MISMPENEEEKQSIQKNLLQELRDLQAVLDAETVDSIPVLSDVVTALPAAGAADAAAKTPVDDSGIPQLDDRILPDDDAAANTVAKQSNTANASVPEPPLVTEKAAPFALIESSADEYDSSAAESLIEDGLSDTLAPLTEQMDDEALRLVDQLVAEHVELIRQQLKLKLAAKSKQLHVERENVPP